MFSFKVVSKSRTTRARAGLLQTAHGVVETPVFMPVGTLGTVKSQMRLALVKMRAELSQLADAYGLV